MSDGPKPKRRKFSGIRTGVNSSSQHVRSYAPKGQTPVVELRAERFGVNMVSALSNRGKLLSMLYRETLDAQRCIDFMKRLVANANKSKLFLMLDNLRVHHAKRVKERVEKNKEAIKIFYLPTYSP